MATSPMHLVLSLLLPVCLGHSFLSLRSRKATPALPASAPAVRHQDMALLWAMAAESPNATTALNATTPTSLRDETWLSYRPCATCKSYVRLGEGHDGGYLMCGELIEGTRAVYSYGINGFDGWGAALSDRLGGVAIEQYDCFNLNRPACPSALQCSFNFHPECAGTTTKTVDSRLFSSLSDQMTKNGHLPGPDSGADMVMKMDIEGAEWEIFADDRNKDLLKHFSQLVVEFHHVQLVNNVKAKAMKNLLELFSVVHVHPNNCCRSLQTPDGHSIPVDLEVTFVRRGLAQEQTCTDAPVDSPLDHRNVVEKPHSAPMRFGV